MFISWKFSTKIRAPKQIKVTNHRSSRSWQLRQTFSALSIYYLVVSCYPVLPWTECHDNLQTNESVICIPSGANVTDYRQCFFPNETSYNQTVCVRTGTELDQVRNFLFDYQKYFIQEIMKYGMATLSPVLYVSMFVSQSYLCNQ